MKIKDIPFAEVRELALQEQERQGNERNDNISLNDTLVSFVWFCSELGFDFWVNIYFERYEEAKKIYNWDEPIKQDNKIKRTFESGSVRDIDDNKPIPFELNPYTLIRYGYHMKKNQSNYGDGNWQLGQPDKEIWRSLSRHFTQAYYNFAFPELSKDTDDNTDHLSALIFGINMLMHNENKNGVKANKYFEEWKKNK